ncbi:MAG: A24 family peptidase [Elusimicrobiota bacterium]|jgi:leader peptidase (prepilin peptidase)/N-methyltransferase|nr:A24 family peptidase [Elusimicrobiota bacterium]
MTIADKIIFIICAALLFAASVIDYKKRIIPPIFPTLLFVCGIFLAVFNIAVYKNFAFDEILHCLLGAVSGGLFLIIAALIGKIFFAKETIGGGDIKLMAGIGSVIGWDKAIFANIAAFFIASVVGIILILAKKLDRRGYMPFAPFLSAGVYISIILPQTYINYFSKIML